MVKCILLHSLVHFTSMHRAKPYPVDAKSGRRFAKAPERAPPPPSRAVPEVSELGTLVTLKEHEGGKFTTVLGILPAFTGVTFHDIANPATSAAGLEVLHTKARATLGRLSDRIASLTDEQRIPFDLLTGDKFDLQPIIFTGKPGTGKSHVKNTILMALREAHIPCIELGPTHASIESNPFDGFTINSFFQLAIDSDYTDPAQREWILKKMVEAAQGAPYVSSAIHYVKKGHTPIVFIEEASMVDRDKMDLILDALKLLVPGPGPAGAFQVICCGDPFQLAAIPMKKNLPPGTLTPLFMSARTMEHQHVIALKRNMRVDDDEDRAEFLSLLDAIRVGRAGRSEWMQLDTLGRPLKAEGPLRSLFARRLEVAATNLAHIQSLPLEHTYTVDAKDTLYDERKGYSGVFYKANLPSRMHMALGAEIIFESTGGLYKAGLHCGTRGQIVAFVQASCVLPVVYVPDLDMAIVIRPVTEEISRSFRGNRTLEGTRVQFPFSVAAATTMHKSQGETIRGKVHVSLAHATQYGQAYVALSRATSLKNLRVTSVPGVGAQGIMYGMAPHPEAILWAQKHDLL